MILDLRAAVDAAGGDVNAVYDKVRQDIRAHLASGGEVSGWFDDKEIPFTSVAPSGQLMDSKKQGWGLFPFTASNVGSGQKHGIEFKDKPTTTQLREQLAATQTAGASPEASRKAGKPKMEEMPAVDFSKLLEAKAEKEGAKRLAAPQPTAEEWEKLGKTVGELTRDAMVKSGMLTPPVESMPEVHMLTPPVESMPEVQASKPEAMPEQNTLTPSVGRQGQEQQSNRTARYDDVDPRPKRQRQEYAMDPQWRLPRFLFPEFSKSMGFFKQFPVASHALPRIESMPEASTIAGDRKSRSRIPEMNYGIGGGGAGGLQSGENPKDQNDDLVEAMNLLIDEMKKLREVMEKEKQDRQVDHESSQATKISPPQPAIGARKNRPTGPNAPQNPGIMRMLANAVGRAIGG